MKTNINTLANQQANQQSQSIKIEFPVLPIEKAKVDVLFIDPNYPKFLGIHSGWDINLKSGGNTDLGYPFRSIADGEVVYATDDVPGNNNWGGLIVIYHPELGVYSRYGHHQPGTCKVKKGTKVKCGEILAGIGRGRNNAFLAHLHFDILCIKPPHWGYWVSSSKEIVKKVFFDPYSFFKKYKVKTPLSF